MVGIKQISIRTAENGQDYTGIKISADVDESTEIIVPRYYMPEMNKPVELLSKDEKRKLKRLTKAWGKYQKRAKTKNNGEFEGEGMNFDFDVVFRLIQDFLEYGLYTEFEKTEKLSNVGKIDFPRTIKRCTPILIDDDPLYLPYITRTKKVADENLVRDTQVLVLNDISNKVGWLVGFNVFIPQTGIKEGLDKSLITKLKMAKNTSYNTRKINLIDYLIRYLTMLNVAGNNNRELFVSVVYKFWEDMISETIGNVDKGTLDRIFYIRHRYRNKKTGVVSRMPRELNPLQPDSVFMEGNDIIIIDAKYYDENNTPQNDDITKQFAYMRKAYGYYGPSHSYRNIFVLPTEHNNHYSNKEAIFDPDLSMTDDLVPIEVLYLNVTEIVENYIASNNISASVL